MADDSAAPNTGSRADGAFRFTPDQSPELIDSNFILDHDSRLRLVRPHNIDRPRNSAMRYGSKKLYCDTPSTAKMRKLPYFSPTARALLYSGEWRHFVICSMESH